MEHMRAWGLASQLLIFKHRGPKSTVFHRGHAVQWREISFSSLSRISSETILERRMIPEAPPRFPAALSLSQCCSRVGSERVSERALLRSVSLRTEGRDGGEGRRSARADGRVGPSGCGALTRGRRIWSSQTHRHGTLGIPVRRVYLFGAPVREALGMHWVTPAHPSAVRPRCLCCIHRWKASANVPRASDLLKGNETTYHVQTSLQSRTTRPRVSSRNLDLAISILPWLIGPVLRHSYFFMEGATRAYVQVGNFSDN